MQNLTQMLMQKWGRIAVRQATNRHALLLTTSAMMAMLLVGCGGSSSDDSTAAPVEETIVVSSDNFPANVLVTHTVATGEVTETLFSLQYGGLYAISDEAGIVKLVYQDTSESTVVILSAEFGSDSDLIPEILLDEYEIMLLEGKIEYLGETELQLISSAGDGEKIHEAEQWVSAEVMIKAFAEFSLDPDDIDLSNRENVIEAVIDELELQDVTKINIDDVIENQGRISITIDGADGYAEVYIEAKENLIGLRLEGYAVTIDLIGGPDGVQDYFATLSFDGQGNPSLDEAEVIDPVDLSTSDTAIQGALELLEDFSQDDIDEALEYNGGGIFFFIEGTDGAYAQVSIQSIINIFGFPLEGYAVTIDVIGGPDGDKEYFATLSFAAEGTNPSLDEAEVIDPVDLSTSDTAIQGLSRLLEDFSQKDINEALDSQIGGVWFYIDATDGNYAEVYIATKQNLIGFEYPHKYLVVIDRHDDSGYITESYYATLSFDGQGANPSLDVAEVIDPVDLSTELAATDAVLGLLEDFNKVEISEALEYSGGGISITIKGNEGDDYAVVYIQSEPNLIGLADLDSGRYLVWIDHYDVNGDYSDTYQAYFSFDGQGSTLSKGAPEVIGPVELSTEAAAVSGLLGLLADFNQDEINEALDPYGFISIIIDGNDGDSADVLIESEPNLIGLADPDSGRYVVFISHYDGNGDYSDSYQVYFSFDLQGTLIQGDPEVIGPVDLSTSDTAIQGLSRLLEDFSQDDIDEALEYNGGRISIDIDDTAGDPAYVYIQAKENLIGLPLEGYAVSIEVNGPDGNKEYFATLSFDDQGMTLIEDEAEVIDPFDFTSEETAVAGVLLELKPFTKAQIDEALEYNGGRISIDIDGTAYVYIQAKENLIGLPLEGYAVSIYGSGKDYFATLSFDDQGMTLIKDVPEVIDPVDLSTESAAIAGVLERLDDFIQKDINEALEYSRGTIVIFIDGTAGSAADVFIELKVNLIGLEVGGYAVTIDVFGGLDGNKEYVATLSFTDDERMTLIKDVAEVIDPVDLSTESAAVEGVLELLKPFTKAQIDEAFGDFGEIFFFIGNDPNGSQTAAIRSGVTSNLNGNTHDLRVMAYDESGQLAHRYQTTITWEEEAGGDGLHLVAVDEHDYVVVPFDCGTVYEHLKSDFESLNLTANNLIEAISANTKINAANNDLYYSGLFYSEENLVNENLEVSIYVDYSGTPRFQVKDFYYDSATGESHFSFHVVGDLTWDDGAAVLMPEYAYNEDLTGTIELSAVDQGALLGLFNQASFNETAVSHDLETLADDSLRVKESFMSFNYTSDFVGEAEFAPYYDHHVSVSSIDVANGEAELYASIYAYEGDWSTISGAQAVLTSGFSWNPEDDADGEMTLTWDNDPTYCDIY